MKSRGNFIFRGLEKRDGGIFKNSQGQEISYKESYRLKVDESTDKGMVERIFKVSVDSPLIQQLQNVKIYDNVVIEFDINIYSSRVSLEPVSLINTK